MSIYQLYQQLQLYFSTWLDYRMNDLLHIIPSYIRDSKALLKVFKTLYLPPGIRLFTANATAMYTNIETNANFP
jgi:hypothetical protein